MSLLALDVDTPHGPARIHLQVVEDPRGALVLGHGAGGGVQARDLVTAAAAARESRFSVALVEQPYRVAGRRSPAPAAQLDAAWIAVCERLATRELRDLPLVTGGRSSGARVACRTAAAVGARGVLCLAFPLVAPSGTSRLEELDSVTVPVLVVQGQNDRFGIPTAAQRREVVVIRGDHALRSDLAAVDAAVRRWLPGVTRIRPARPARPGSRRSSGDRAPRS
jgi:uncharacterized protein